MPIRVNPNKFHKLHLHLQAIYLALKVTLKALHTYTGVFNPAD